MTGLKIKLTVILFMVVSMVNSQELTKLAVQTMGGVNLKFAEDATIKVRGGLNFFHQIEQEDLLDVNLYPEIEFEEEGYMPTAQEAAAGLEVNLGKIRNLEISVGGEFLSLWRTIKDSANYWELRPTGLLNFTLPLGPIFKAQHFIRCERRIFRDEDAPFAKFRYSSQSRLSALLPGNIEIFGFYHGYSMKETPSMSQFGGGLIAEPIQDLMIEAGWSILWQPELEDRNIKPVYLGVTYNFDLTQ